MVRKAMLLLIGKNISGNVKRGIFNIDKILIPQADITVLNLYAFKNSFEL